MTGSSGYYFSQSEYKQSFGAAHRARMAPRPLPIKAHDSGIFGPMIRSQPVESGPFSHRPTTPPTPPSQQDRRPPPLAVRLKPNSLNFYFDHDDNAATTTTKTMVNTASGEEFKANFAKSFDESNRGFGDMYAKTRGDSLVHLRGLSNNSDKSSEQQQQWQWQRAPPTTGIRTGKRLLSRNMFASHIDSHMYPGKYDVIQPHESSAKEQSSRAPEQSSVQSVPSKEPTEPVVQPVESVPTVPRVQISYSLNDQSLMIPTVRYMPANSQAFADVVNSRGYIKTNSSSIALSTSDFQPAATRKTTYQYFYQNMFNKDSN